MRTFAYKPKATQRIQPAKSTKAQLRTMSGQSRDARSILHFQRAIGNQAIQRLLQSNAEQLDGRSGATASSRFGHDFSRTSVHSGAPKGIQAKLQVSSAADQYEREADVVADQVMRMPEPQQQTKCDSNGGEYSGNTQTRGQLLHASGSGAGEVVSQVLRSPGQSLSPAIRRFMEPRFDADFSNVRIHSDGAAEASAALIQARAYTVGRHITLGRDASENDRSLMAHELAHVVQQGAVEGRTSRSSRIQPTVQRQESGGPSPAPEAEAAVRHAQAIRSTGNILFDSWGNDVRDNDNDGSVDSGRRETDTYDGQHYSRTYTDFGVVAGTYIRGWRDEHGVSHSRVTVPTTRTITGTFRYQVCADIVSQAYADAGLMEHTRSTGRIIRAFRRIGTVWQDRSTFPSEYLPGDFVATYAAGGGHSGIVTTRSPTSSAPTVIELPGPSTQADAGTYDPASTNDVKEQTWSKQGVADQYQYLGRYTGGRRRR